MVTTSGIRLCDVVHKNRKINEMLSFKNKKYTHIIRADVVRVETKKKTKANAAQKWFRACGFCS